MGRCGRGLHERCIRQPADIAVTGKLTPRPAFAVAVVYRDALAAQRLCHQHRVRRRLFAHGRDRLDYLEFLARDETIRLHLAFEVFCSEVAARGCQPWIVAWIVAWISPR